jgi:uncharacterized tellurite resistance protein B-like protein
MSEPVLKAIIKLFALVAKEDLVTKQEREQIEAFLQDHLSQKALAPHLKIFDDYVAQLGQHLTAAQEEESIKSLCLSINQEVAQKQKAVIMIELMSIVCADQTITPKEEQLTRLISQSLNVNDQDMA